MSKQSKTRSIAETTVDPTLPFTPVIIGDKTYQMCFDLGALAQAEHELVEQGHDVNLLYALPRLNLENVRIVFAASIRKFHPEIRYDDAVELLTLPHLHQVSAAIVDAWNKSLAEPAEDGDEQNPTEPAP